MPPQPLRDVAGWIAAHWRPYRGRLLWVVALTFVNGAVVVVYPIFLQRIVDGIGESTPVSFLVENALWLLAFGAVHAVVYYNLMVTRMRVNLGLDYGVRMRAFEHLLRMGPSFFTRFRTGDLVTRLTDDVTEKLAWYLCSGIFRTLEALTIIVFGVVMMLRMDPELTLWAAGPLPVLVGIYVALAARLHRRYEAVQAAISRVNDALESAFSGIRVIKGFATEPMQTALVEGAVDRQRRAEIRAVRIQTVIDSLYGHIWQLAIVAVLLAGGTLVIAGDLTLGQLVAFDAYVLLLVWPMFDVGQFLVRGRVSAVSIGRISELEGVSPEVGEAGFAPLAPRLPRGPLVEDAGEIPDRAEAMPVEFREVEFRYGETLPPVLDGVSFRAEPGSLTALAGEVGSGKSTALKLAARLMDPVRGEVAAAGRALPDWDADRLRGALGYVSQEAILFSTTVFENIRFGRSWIPEEDVALAAETAGLGADLRTWTDGMETVVGAHGIRLSGGQKQRVALARALAGRPSVLLLDDCTSALDAETEDRVWEALFRELPRCTTLLVTHRPATLERAGRIVVLAGGRVEGVGTFDELNLGSARFHELYMRWRLRDRVEG